VLLVASCEEKSLIKKVTRHTKLHKVIMHILVNVCAISERKLHSVSQRTKEVLIKSDATLSCFISYKEIYCVPV